MLLYRVPSAFHGEPVALRIKATEEDRREVWYCQQTNRGDTRSAWIGSQIADSND